MADIELVVKMPENTYRRIQALVRSGYFEHDICGNSMRRIANGIPLPKGHGRLIDGDELERHMKIGYKIVRDAKTIIEADKTESEEV
jgi:hypothetical protein